MSLLVEIHNINDPSHYNNVIELLKHHNYEMTFEQLYEGSGEGHVIFRKKNNNSNLNKNNNNL
jgi:hypothetical protein